jgi:hypothetical protein
VPGRQTRTTIELLNHALLAEHAALKGRRVLVYTIALDSEATDGPHENAGLVIEAIEAKGWWLEHISVRDGTLGPMVAVFRRSNAAAGTEPEPHRPETP